MNISGKDALYGRFFMPVIWGIVSILYGPLSVGDTYRPCHAEAYSSRIVVRHVIDGDTVNLSNGTNLRLIGLDTPEIGHGGEKDEPGAIAAREYLTGQLSNQSSLPVVFDTEKRDQYGRLLGHLFLEDGTNIQARMLAEGYGTPLIIPPNLKFFDCYRIRADAAMAAKRGIWSYHSYRTFDVTEMKPADKGYRIIRGPVTRVGESASSIWVNMGNYLALRIVKSDLKYFTEIDLRGLTGKTVLARGMVYRRNRQQRIRIRHPADLRIMPKIE